MNKRIGVGHVIRQYLRLTENFIQSFLIHAHLHTPQVLTDILTPIPLGDIPCVYLIDQDEVSAMAQQDRHLFFSKLNYPSCYVDTVVDRQMDILHAHFGLMGYRTLALQQHTQLPLVVSFYGIDASQMLKMRRWQEPFAQVFERADVVTALGSDMADRLCRAGCSERKIHIVHLGVDLSAIPFRARVLPDANQPIVLLYCGRLVEKKGIFDALDAFARVADKWPQLIFRIVGDGDLRLQLERKVGAMRVRDRVQLMGGLSHRRVLQEMAASHLFILPSKTSPGGDMEGTPTVLLEAQASGLPVLSTFHADIPEVVCDGKSGYLVGEGHVDLLAEKLDHLLCEHTSWKDLGYHGRTHIDNHYNIHSEITKLERIYQFLV